MKGTRTDMPTYEDLPVSAYIRTRRVNGYVNVRISVSVLRSAERRTREMMAPRDTFGEVRSNDS